MGNFHCIFNGCAKVVYREYLAPVVRWRYPDEDWQEIEGDDYTSQAQAGQCLENYTCILKYKFVTDAGIQERQAFLFYTRGEILGTATRYVRTSRNWSLAGIVYTPDYPNGRSAGTSLNLAYQLVTDSLEVIYYLTSGQPDDCGDCTFIITSNGETVYTETRPDCPEVEKLPCRLSDEVKEIKIDKLPYLERVEVRNQTVNTIYVSPLDAPFLDTKSLPNECLNIYNTLVTAPPFLSDYMLLPGVINPYQFIAQICSANGCPPPEISVICNCDEDSCQSCPDGTCAVDCNEQICCYDTNTGIAVKQIAVADYCGGTL